MADALGARTALLAFAGLAGIPVLLVLLVPAVRAVRRREGLHRADAFGTPGAEPQAEAESAAA